MNYSEINGLKAELVDAVRGRNIDDMIKVLEKGMKEGVELTDAELAGMPLVLYCAQTERWDMLDELYMANASLNAKYDVANWTLLHQLCATNRIEELKNYLPEISNGYEREKNNGQNAMMICIDKGHKEIFEMLVDIKLDFRQVDNNNNNTFHYLAKVQWLDLLKVYGQNPTYNNLLNAKNKEGETPLSLSGLKMVDIIDNEVSEKTEVERVDGVNKEQEVSNEVTKPKLSKLKGTKRL